MTKKTLTPTNDMYIQFTDEEIREAGWEAGQKLETILHNDGSIELRPYVKVELDIEEWPKEVLLMLIKESLEQDIPVNDVINSLLKESLNNLPALKDEPELLNEDVLSTARNSDYSTYSSDVQPTLNVNLSTSGYSVADVDPNFTSNDTSSTDSYAYKYIDKKDMLFNG